MLLRRTVVRDQAAGQLLKFVSSFGVASLSLDPADSIEGLMRIAFIELFAVGPGGSLIAATAGGPSPAPMVVMNRKSALICARRRVGATSWMIADM